MYYKQREREEERKGGRGDFGLVSNDQHERNAISFIFYLSPKQVIIETEKEKNKPISILERWLQQWKEKEIRRQN